VIQHIATIGPFWEEMYDLDAPINSIKFKLNKYFIYKTAKNADAMIFESMYTKKYFINTYKIDYDKGHVINYGKDKYFYKTNDEKELENYQINKPFALCVSHLYPYKNIIRMIEAFHIALSQNDSNYELIIAGKIYYDDYYKMIKKCINNYKMENIVKTIGLVNQQELRNLYSNADFLIFPSPCENFAYTLVEAMCCGIPITCSNTTAMPETCEDAAIYFDPNNKGEMAEKIESLMEDKKLREKLSYKALNRVKNLPDYEDGTKVLLNIFNTLCT